MNSIDRDNSEPPHRAKTQRKGGGGPVFGHDAGGPAMMRRRILAGLVVLLLLVVVVEVLNWTRSAPEEGSQPVHIEADDVGEEAVSGAATNSHETQASP